MLKKCAIIILMITLAFTMCACQKKDNSKAQESNEVEQKKENSSSSESNLESKQEKASSNNTNKVEQKKENGFSNELELEGLIKDGRVLIKELAFDANKPGNLEPLKYWTSALDLDYFTTNGSMARAMSLKEKKNQDAALIYQHYDRSSKYLSYVWEADNDFTNIDTKELLMYMKGIYGIDIDEKHFNEVIENYKKIVFDLEKETVKSTVFYNKNKISIKLAALYDGKIRRITLVTSYNK